MPARPSSSSSYKRTGVRLVPLLVALVLAVVSTELTVDSDLTWLWLAIPTWALVAVGIFDLVQRRHSVLRTYPIVGHGRWIAELLRPEIHQYFVESDTDGRPYDRVVRSMIYERAKGGESESPFGSELLLEAPGSEFFAHTIASVKAPEAHPRVRIGGPHCTKPYDMALLNVSAMSFGALSGNAIRALNAGAAKGGFAHDTGEGGISPYHREHGGDLIWEIGSGYFGCRTKDGDFNPDRFREQVADDQIKCVSIKLSQGAKPGIGGVLPGPKVTKEIAKTREVPQGQTVTSPPSHTAFHTPLELIAFVQQLRELSDGKPVGFKLCLGRRVEFLAICKAMIETGDGPDFIIVDGSEGGTGAAPTEFQDVVGTPLTEALLFIHNALVGAGLRDRLRLGVSGKIATGADMVRRMSLGADYCNSARAMMMATGCIQSLRCHTNTCPTGVATQDPKLARSLDVPTKTERVANYQKATVDSALKIMAAMGITDPSDLDPILLHRNDELPWSHDYTALYSWLRPGQLLEGDAPESWTALWGRAHADTFDLTKPTWV
ncbi:MAG: FMN-binding glutamate synthase family protein [Patulibacter sp.]|nr:FMN-binding glutamate synthase family protein [Patulibacter sp.]